MIPSSSCIALCFGTHIKKYRAFIKTNNLHVILQNILLEIYINNQVF